MLDSKPTGSHGADPIINMLVVSHAPAATPEVHSHRQKIVKEIFDTEHSYISQLNTIVSVSAPLSFSYIAVLYIAVLYIAVLYIHVAIESASDKSCVEAWERG